MLLNLEVTYHWKDERHIWKKDYICDNLERGRLPERINLWVFILFLFITSLRMSLALLESDKEHISLGGEGE